MSKKMAIVLIVFGAALVGLGFAMRQVVPRHGNTTSLAGLAGGGLCLLWGIAALAGLKGRTWAVLTAIPTALVMLSQTVQVWMPLPDGDSMSLPGRLIATVMTVSTVGLVMYLFHGERPPEFYEPRRKQRRTPASDGIANDLRNTPGKR